MPEILEISVALSEYLNIFQISVEVYIGQICLNFLFISYLFLSGLPMAEWYFGGLFAVSMP